MKNAIEVLEKEFQISTHFSKYPQDRWKNDPQQISVLITTAEYHKKLADEYAKAINVLKNEN
jgi:hypothetical protein|tara:strand:- start:698 stop:883 length:186 start_codon:yes stop_codon:yes gene_type:complete